MAPPRAACIIGSLRMGGATKVFAQVANHLASRGWRISIITIHKEEIYCDLHPEIELIELDMGMHMPSRLGPLERNWKRFKGLKEALAKVKPEVALSFIDRTNVLSILAAKPLKIPVVVSERSDPRRRDDMKGYWGYLRKISYPKACRLVVQSQELADYSGPAFGANVQVIPNSHSILPGPPLAQRRKLIVAMGRLHSVKRYDLLVDACSLIREDLKGWEVEIWGQGPEKNRLEQRISSHGLEGLVRLMGPTKDPVGVAQQASLLVQSSDVEGFPNAVLEALASGAPVVSTRCGGALNDIIEDEVNGLLTDPGSVEGLASAIKRMVTDEDLRLRLGEKAAPSASRFQAEPVMKAWEDLLLECRAKA